MDTTKIKKFAQFARRTLIGQIGAKLDAVIAENSPSRRESPKTVKELEGQIFGHGRDQVVERVAYTWFNRFSALRYMDVTYLNSVRVVSPLPGQFQPEILAEAKAGNIDGSRVPESVRDQIHALLDGRAPSQNPHAEAYRLLLVAMCNDWHEAMPFLFEKITDYTELLMPEDLLSIHSILAYTREAMTPDACEDVEIIGWLYQFYVSEKKDEVFAGLKKNKKVTPENIPAATQLYTPHWIVRYLVENSLGRLWMLNRPFSRLIKKMDYYIVPEEQEEDFLRLSSPEEIKVCDPACGSGHMLTYAFDLLYAIYEEEGYDPSEIPEKILTKNLYGIEIDERAGALAAFALAMKAAGRRKRFLGRMGKNGVKPNICVLENVSFKDRELADYMKKIGNDLFIADLRETLGQFAEVKNFGSLIVPKIEDVTEIRRMIAAKDLQGDMFYGDVHARVLTVLRMADYLGPKYHAVVANPPYMAAPNMNPLLKRWISKQFPNSKADLMTCFMERASTMLHARGFWSIINLPSWLFNFSNEELRNWLIKSNKICAMAYFGRGVFGSDFGSVATVVCKRGLVNNEKTVILKLFENHVDVRSNKTIEKIFVNNQGGRYVVNQLDLFGIPGTPIAFWAAPKIRETFSRLPALSESGVAASGIQTSDNELYLRFWHEVSLIDIFSCTNGFDEVHAPKAWVPHNKGGAFRRWYGNQEYVMGWHHSGNQAKEDPKFQQKNMRYQMKEAATWSHTSSGSFSVRYSPPGRSFNVEGPVFIHQNDVIFGLAFLASTVALHFMNLLNPTLHFLVGSVQLLPICKSFSVPNAKLLIDLGRADWDAYETSWGFTTLPLLSPNHRSGTVESTYARLRTHWRNMTLEMRRLEEENNRIFIDAYGLQNELVPEVPPEECTLTCNPAYRYGGKKPLAELETLLLADTTREFLSYAVGCMFGRYSLDTPGLILASQGEGIEEYLVKIPDPTFEPDADNVIPVLDGDWFPDDITERFRKFLRVTFGEARFQENLAFIEDALGKELRAYLLRDFYADHVKRYKKRPIYWMFSSPKGTFNTLIYMHRYRPDTVSVVLNDYLREFRNKLEAHRKQLEALTISAEATQGQKTMALKKIEATSKQIEEVVEWERDVLYPLATQRIEIDLDEGVKVNYPKFGAALKPIKGLSDTGG